MIGIVFDIKEFAVHDGPGIRTTVFLKGCPLRCAWCHNPEGLSPEPQAMVAPSGERRVGRAYRAEELAGLLLTQAEILADNGGGVTFSGGEPLMQCAFVSAVLDRLAGMHVLLDTSGYAELEEFLRVAQRCHLVYYDLKMMDPESHRLFTGVGNARILENLCALGSTGVPYVVRVPLVPGVTDTEANLEAIAEFVAPLPNLQRVDLLPYNRAAGAKYAACGMTFAPTWDENGEPCCSTTAFSRRGVPVRVR